jgi:hypothetical protein
MKETSEFLPIGLTRSMINWSSPIITMMGRAAHLRDGTFGRKLCESEVKMRARRVATGSEFRLFQDEQAIGYVDGTSVSFRGLETPDDAALAASAAQHALARRREQQPGTADVATLLRPSPDESAIGGWGFKIALLPSERVEVFALARARVIWQALQGAGISRRMRQFAGGLATV